MANMNKVFLIGNLVRDPELRYIPSGEAVANLRIAVNRFYTTKEGEKKKETCFITVVAWRRQAENCGEYLSKGSSILVEGRLRESQWETSTGEKRSRIEVTANQIQFLDRRGSQKEDKPPDSADRAPEAAEDSGEKTAGSDDSWGMSSTEPREES